MDPISKILVSSSEFILDKNNLAKANLPEFKSDQLLKATVIKSLSAKQVQLSIFGKKITAKTHVPLKSGDVLFLKAISSGKQQVLKLVELRPEVSTATPRVGFSEALNRSGPLAQLVHLFEQTEPTEPSVLDPTSAPNRPLKTKTTALDPELAQIKTLINRMALKSERPDPLLLKTILNQGGLILEDKLANLIGAEKQVIEKGLDDISQNDLKALALKLAHKPEINRNALKSEHPDLLLLKTILNQEGLTLEDKSANLIGTEKQVIEKGLDDISQNDLNALALKLAHKTNEEKPSQHIKLFLDNLENYQLLNKQAFKDLGRYLIPFPMLFDNTYKFGQLFLDLGRNDDKRAASTNNLVRVAVLLELSQMGDMLADFSILKKAINGSFQLTQTDAFNTVQEHIPELKSKLMAHGFVVHQITCHLTEPAKLAEATLADRMVENDPSSFNLFV